MHQLTFLDHSLEILDFVLVQRFDKDSFDKYIEPFVGAGAMFIWAYEQNPEAKFVLNDSNESIISIYK